jgi:hypothetical protein
MGRRIPRVPGEQVDAAAAPTRAATAPGAEAPSEQGLLEKLKNMIPTETVTLYIGGVALIPSNMRDVVGLVWAIICLVATLALVAKQSQTEPGKPTEKHPVAWVQVIIASISFVLLVYVLGGVETYVPSFGLEGLLMLAWVSLTAIFYPGAKTG